MSQVGGGEGERRTGQARRQTCELHPDMIVLVFLPFCFPVHLVIPCKHSPHSLHCERERIYSTVVQALALFTFESSLASMRSVQVFSLAIGLAVAQHNSKHPVHD